MSKMEQNITLKMETYDMIFYRFSLGSYRYLFKNNSEISREHDWPSNGGENLVGSITGSDPSPCDSVQ